jgi:hypothetical protein
MREVLICTVVGPSTLQQQSTVKLKVINGSTNAKKWMQSYAALQAGSGHMACLMITPMLMSSLTCL